MLKAIKLPIYSQVVMSQLAVLELLEMHQHAVLAVLKDTVVCLLGQAPTGAPVRLQRAMLELPEMHQHVVLAILMATLARLLGPVQAGVIARLHRVVLVLLQHAALATLLLAIPVPALGANRPVPGVTARWPAAVKTNTLSTLNAQRALLELQEMQATKKRMAALPVLPQCAVLTSTSSTLNALHALLAQQTSMATTTLRNQTATPASSPCVQQTSTLLATHALNALVEPQTTMAAIRLQAATRSAM